MKTRIYCSNGHNLTLPRARHPSSGRCAKCDRMYGARTRARRRADLIAYRTGRS